MPNSQVKHIPFNKPFFTGNEIEYIRDAVERGHISGNGYYTKKCQSFFERRYGFNKCLLTTSCTDALEMAAILLEIKEGDEVIMPSFTFVSTANAFVLRGAKIIFVDSRDDHPGMDEDKIEEVITKKTKAIVPVHYGGVACDMDKIMHLANKYDLFVVEDAAQAIDSYYKGKPLGGIGHLSTFSFHETKNISCGEGGMLVINHPEFEERAEIIWEKGTNRAAFWRGEVDKYGWVDIGSSFLMSDLNAAVLYAQLLHLDEIQERRVKTWEDYNAALGSTSLNFSTPYIPDYATNNAHMYYLIFENINARSAVIQKLKAASVSAVFHYQSLHKSAFFEKSAQNIDLPNSDRYTDCLLRLPFYVELGDEVEKVLRILVP